MVDNKKPLPTLLFATQNQGKLLEARRLCAKAPIELIAPSPEDTLDVSETGSTFAQNAELKAVAFAKNYNCLTIADDSGLEVTALGGEPGVASRRWFPGSDEQRVAALLEKMQHQTERSARFVTVLCLYNPNDTTSVFFEGYVTGTLAQKPAGSTGFGYDPIFVPTGFTKSFAELGTDQKNAISHRAQAFHKLCAYIQTHTFA